MLINQRSRMIILFLLSSFSLHTPQNHLYSQERELQTLTTGLESKIPDLLKRYRVPGTTVALVHEGEVVWSRGFGLADKARGIPCTASTVFQIASISKAVTAWGIMRLVEQGTLDLDTPVESYLTRWQLPETGFDNSGVTARRLLSHTAGLSRHGYPGIHPDRSIPTLEETLTGGPGDPVDVRLIQEPGAEFRYSGGGYTLLSLIVEEVTNENFEAFVQREILKPLGMTQSSYEWTPELQPLTAIGYDDKGEPWPNFLFGGKGCCSLYATAPDLARFAAAGMPGPNEEPSGRGVLTPKSVELMYTPVAELTGFAKLFGTSIGLGHFLETLSNGIRLVFHSGDNRGWHAVLAFMPDEREGIVVLTNGDVGGIHLWIDILRVWSHWACQSTPMLCRFTRMLNITSLSIAVISTIGFVFFGGYVIIQMRSGRRKWGRVPGHPFPLRRTLIIGFSLLIIASWWLVVYPVLPFFIPLTANWLSLSITLWCATGIFIGLFSKTKKLRRRPSLGAEIEDL
jgi:CubicO group peptidase (beta-lactamase class C family)